ncbi:MAG: TetR/AcrR family transcriptional regulator, partial [Lachnospiraceae bacterium]
MCKINGNGTTLENIHQAAKAEFLEKGYKDASLRNIVKSVGM